MTHHKIPDWDECVAKVNDQLAAELAEWRSYTLEYVKDRLRAEKLIGRYQNKWAFPHIDFETKEVIGVHYRIESKNGEKPQWIHWPPGNKVQPFVLGDLVNAKIVHCFEGQWDKFTLDDQLKLYQHPDIALISTRGAPNAKLLGLIPPTVETIYLWPQNDPARNDGKPTGSEIWLADGIQHLAGRKVRIVRTPQGYKDLNEWVQNAEIGEPDLRYAIEHAETPPESEPASDKASNEAKAAPESNNVAFLADPEPWPEPVDITEVLNEIIEIIGQHIWMDEHRRLTVSLWIIMTWVTDAVDTLPLLTISSPMLRSGKTRLLTVIKRIVRRAVGASNISAAALYRVVEKSKPTLVVDEFDSFGKDNEDLRNVINSGHTKDSTDLVIRCHPKTLEPEPFSTFCPKAIGLIGKLHPTTHDRAIVIGLERKPRHVMVEPLRKTSSDKYETLRRKLARWGMDHRKAISAAQVANLESLHDRANDNWFPLLAITQVAGEQWKQKALAAVAALDPGEDDEDIKTTLLTALRAIFKEGFAEYRKEHLIAKESEFSMLATEIQSELNEDNEAPWADWHYGKDKQGMSQAKLASMLRRFKGPKGKPIKSEEKQVDGVRGKRYFLAHLQPVFDAYLPPEKEPEK
jgi:putative DNA primase/helicase